MGIPGASSLLAEEPSSLVITPGPRTAGTAEATSVTPSTAVENPIVLTASRPAARRDGSVIRTPDPLTQARNAGRGCPELRTRGDLTTRRSTKFAMTGRWYVALSDRDLTTRVEAATTCVHQLRPMQNRKRRVSDNKRQASDRSTSCLRRGGSAQKPTSASRSTWADRRTSPAQARGSPPASAAARP